MGIAVLNLLFYVRNAYGIFWLISFVAIAGLVIYSKEAILMVAFSLLCSFIVLTDAVISGITLLVIAVREPKSAGDAKNLSEATHLPVVFWALLLLAFSVFCAYKTIWVFFPKIF